MRPGNVIPYLCRMYTAAHSIDPHLCIDGTYYKRKVGVGWIVIPEALAPPASKFYPIPASQWAIYRVSMVSAGLISEEKATAIASTLVDAPPAKRFAGSESQAALAVVAIETEKPNPDELGL